jgi:hypothetical protein
MIDIMDHFVDTDHIARVLQQSTHSLIRYWIEIDAYYGKTRCDMQAYSIYAWPWTLRDFHTFFS